MTSNESHDPATPAETAADSSASTDDVQAEQTGNQHGDQSTAPKTTDESASKTASEAGAESTTETEATAETGSVDNPTGATFEQLAAQALEACKNVFDPEIPVNIYELGLIYDVTVDENRNAHVTMTLTSPACPAAAYATK